jgi:hypothetical protein
MRQQRPLWRDGEEGFQQVRGPSIEAERRHSETQRQSHPGQGRGGGLRAIFTLGAAGEAVDFLPTERRMVPISDRASFPKAAQVLPQSGGPTSLLSPPTHLLAH